MMVSGQRHGSRNSRDLTPWSAREKQTEHSANGASPLRAESPREGHIFSNKATPPNPSKQFHQSGTKSQPRGAILIQAHTLEGYIASSRQARASSMQ